MKETFILTVDSKDGIDDGELWGIIMDTFPECKITLLKKD